MPVDTVTLVGGAMGVFLIGTTVFQPGRESTRRKKTLGLLAKASAVSTYVGWLMMWFTEQAIWSPAPRTCVEFATIELKGQVYRNCAYLVHRYEAGQWLFLGGLAVLAMAAALGRRIKQRF